MKCLNCNIENDDEAFYCKNCGVNIKKFNNNYIKEKELQKIEKLNKEQEKEKKNKKERIALLICLFPIISMFSIVELFLHIILH